MLDTCTFDYVEKKILLLFKCTHFYLSFADYSSGNKSDGSEKSRGSSSTPVPQQTTTDSPSKSTSTTATTPTSTATTTNTGTTTERQQTTTTPSRGSSASPRGSAQSSPAMNSSANSGGAMSAPTGRPVPKRRMRRRATSQSQDPAEQLTEMSVRGLNLFRYASISEGVYQCTECAKLDIQKTFKNKYSFQRHAFLYHEGHQRKVFPCPVCGKEFSRPDKMKNHMKTVHDCFMPKDCVMPFGFFLPP